jgi:predicted Zn-dependent peptidase
VELREKLGLCYYIKTGYSSDPDAGFLATQAGIDNKNLEKAVSAILKEYKKVSKERISLSELKKAKENIKGKMALQLESSDSLASFYSSQELLENRILSLKEVFKELIKLLQRIYRKLLRIFLKTKNLILL